VSRAGAFATFLSLYIFSWVRQLVLGTSLPVISQEHVEDFEQQLVLLLFGEVRGFRSDAGNERSFDAIVALRDVIADKEAAD
jgi:hypothetical protein